MVLALSFAAVPPLAAQATPAAVPVAARVIARGSMLSAEDIADGPASVDALPLVRRATAGWVARRRIDVGEPLREPAVVPPVAAVPGDSVDVVWRDASVMLRVRATLLTAGALGDRVAVRVDAKRRLEGVLTAPRLVVLR
jgi:flagella basal body P-ring formation protein FlgA